MSTLLRNISTSESNLIPFQLCLEITGRYLCSDNDRIMLSLLVRFGGVADFLIQCFIMMQNTNIKTPEN